MSMHPIKVAPQLPAQMPLPPPATKPSFQSHNQQDPARTASTSEQKQASSPLKTRAADRRVLNTRTQASAPPPKQPKQKRMQLVRLIRLIKQLRAPVQHLPQAVLPHR